MQLEKREMGFVGRYLLSVCLVGASTRVLGASLGLVLDGEA